MARYWLHNEMLQVEGKKMSKSLGNFFTVRDLLKQDVPGEVIRFVMLSTHYRKPMDWTEKKRDEATKTLTKWMDLTRDLEPCDPAAFKPDQKLIDALADDLNTHLALTYLNALTAQPQKLLDHARWLGFLSDKSREDDAKARAAYTTSFGSGGSEVLASLASQLDELRQKAMESKDFSQVDAFKAALLDAGAEVRMSKQGVEIMPGPDFDPTKLDVLK
jgi:cysteinyl-tRNA synthetase